MCFFFSLTLPDSDILRKIKGNDTCMPYDTGDTVHAVVSLRLYMSHNLRYMYQFAGKHNSIIPPVPLVNRKLQDTHEININTTKHYQKPIYLSKAGLLDTGF